MGDDEVVEVVDSSEELTEYEIELLAYEVMRAFASLGGRDML